MIDLHLHTTASDGRYSPTELVRRAVAAGITVLSVTDHDTTAGLAEAAACAADHGVEFVPGIEITAVLQDRDVHVLGYFIDPDAPVLEAFLVAQRQDRMRRAREIAERLARLGKPIDIERVIADAVASSRRALGRPKIAAELVRAGHVRTSRQAFDELIGEGRPAFVERRGGTPHEVVARVAEAGGVASLAHPGLLRRDEIIPDLVKAGLPALEVFHSDHSPELTEYYLQMATEGGLVPTGGSDYHGPDSHHVKGLGEVSLPPAHYEQLRALVRRRL